MDSELAMVMAARKRLEEEEAMAEAGLTSSSLPGVSAAKAFFESNGENQNGKPKLMMKKTKSLPTGAKPIFFKDHDRNKDNEHKTTNKTISLPLENPPPNRTGNEEDNSALPRPSFTNQEARRSKEPKKEADSAVSDEKSSVEHKEDAAVSSNFSPAIQSAPGFGAYANSEKPKTVLATGTDIARMKMSNAEEMSANLGTGSLFARPTPAQLLKSMKANSSNGNSNKAEVREHSKQSPPSSQAPSNHQLSSQPSLASSSSSPTPLAPPTPSPSSPIGSQYSPPGISSSEQNLVKSPPFSPLPVASAGPSQQTPQAQVKQHTSAGSS
eukprot:763012-Hanusia_phi.AAC.5